MKDTLNLKRFDLYGQLLTIILPVIYYCIFPDYGHVFTWETIVVMYFWVGSAQVLSCLINKFRLANAWKMPDRKGYEIILVVIAVVAVATSFMKDMLLGVLIVLLYVSPVLALWYLTITVRELLYLKKAATKDIPNTNDDII